MNQQTYKTFLIVYFYAFDCEIHMELTIVFHIYCTYIIQTSTVLTWNFLIQKSIQCILITILIEIDSKE